MRIPGVFALMLVFSWSSTAQWTRSNPHVYVTTTSDRVAIGLTTAGTKLDILGSGTGSDIGRIRVASIDNQAGISFLSNNSGEVVIYSGNNADDLRFQTSATERMVITSGGVIGIGTTNPSSSYKLSVIGKIRATDVKVETGWSDFVFNDEYQLMPLMEVDQYIRENGHLPNVPPAETVDVDGIYLGEMQATLLQKIEELTLYVIDLKKQNEALSERVVSLEKTVPH